MGIPADTRIMGIVHSALRRDLVRCRLLLEYPARRIALADHVLWLTGFLHAHHHGEDEGLYPLVLRENPPAATMIETMNVDHRHIEPAVAELEGAARAYRDDADAAAKLRTALHDLSDVLLPHLEREEREMMPIVSASITDRQWRDWDEEFNLKPKGMLTLAKEGQWLLDGLDDAGRDHVAHLVPPVPRFLLLRILCPVYRRRFARLWGGTPAETIPSQPLPAQIG